MAKPNTTRQSNVRRSMGGGVLPTARLAGFEAPRSRDAHPRGLPTLPTYATGTMSGMKLSISLPDALVSMIDQERGDVTRSRFISRRLIDGAPLKALEPTQSPTPEPAPFAESVASDEWPPPEPPV